MNNRFSSDDIKKKLDSFNKMISMPKLQPPDNIEQILSDLSNYEMVKVLTLDDLESYSILLSNYSLYLQVQENRLKSFINWCESNIKTIVGKELSTSKEYGFQAKDAEIRASNEYISQIENPKIEAEVKLNTIEKLSYKIQNLADILKSVYIERRRFNK